MRANSKYARVLCVKVDRNYEQLSPVRLRRLLLVVLPW
jgi:hypothetical protein